MAGPVELARMRRATRFAKRYLFASGATLYAFTLGLRRPRTRSFIDRVASEFGYRARLRPTLPQVDIAELTPDAVAIELREPVGRDGNVSLLELVVLARLVRSRRPAAIFEIGTFDGRTTLNLAANAPDGATVYTLDLPADPAPALALDPTERAFVRDDLSGIRLRGSDVEHRVQRLRGDSATFDFSPYAAQLVFVDGSHAYEYVKSDSRRAMELLRGGSGVIVWHDYEEWDDVTRALDELRATDAAFAGLRWVRGTTLAVLEVR